uniref:Uncharacterized protein n=1 Tax=Triticum urartu TaxID=4572 RepID=A0A8R7UZY1_TRIUA
MGSSATCSRNWTSRMGIPSRRWRRLWTSSDRNLVFTRDTLFCPQTKRKEDFVRNIDSALCHLSHNLTTFPGTSSCSSLDSIKSNVQCHVDRLVAFCAAMWHQERTTLSSISIRVGSWGRGRANWCTISAVALLLSGLCFSCLCAWTCAFA